MTEAPLEIKVAEMRDGRAMSALEDEIFGNAPLGAIAIAQLISEGTCVAAYLGRELAGYATFIKGPFSCEIMRVAVRKDLRRRGVGSALIKKIVSMAKGFGSESVQLEVRSKNKAAIKLYDKAGFLAVGRRKQYYRDPVDDAVLMDLNLTDKVVFDIDVN